MCLIVYKPEGRMFDRDIIETGIYGNSDGWGDSETDHESAGSPR
jgi:hypothetical protein